MTLDTNIHFADPFSAPGQWYKGNLHTHSTLSDGDFTPGRITRWYRERGYHFVALTDHRIVSEARAVADKFIYLSGVELDAVDPAIGLYHLVGLGFTRPLDLSCYVGKPTTAEAVIEIREMIDRLHAAGALVFLAHPYWSGGMSKDLLEVEGLAGLEVWNGSCEVWDCKGLSAVHWDDLLAADRRLWGFGTDDCHWRPGREDAGLGWVWVKARELTQAAILAALAQGHFYASSGPQIHDLRLEGRELHVRCSPAVAIDFVGNGPFSRRVVARPGATITEASYPLAERQPLGRQTCRYVRVACLDAQGCWAWSNPIFFDPKV
ncbi:MAG: hypothetical protein AUK03_04290 [Anaerolineae bacterium CG2_30_64_16]|nr:MAG: hypothetical protein AUK03_04290 [Anaerolineae bacterium CG2_30_64_16]